MVLLAVLLIMALLAIPVRFVVRLERTDRVRTSGRVRWLFGLADVPFGEEESTREKPAPRPAPAPVARSVGRHWSGSHAAAGLAALRAKGFLRRAVRLLVALVRRITWEELSLCAEFGLDDPADTGRVYGALAPVFLTAAARGVDVRCEPNFLRTCLEGSCATTLRVVPLSVLAVVAQFVLSPPVWRAALAWRAAR